MGNDCDCDGCPAASSCGDADEKDPKEQTGECKCPKCDCDPCECGEEDK